MSYVIGTTRSMFSISDHLVNHCLQVRAGEMTGGAVRRTLYQTLHAQSVILAGRNLVVDTLGVVTQQDIATVTIVWTTG